MEKSSMGSRRHDENDNFNLKEWSLKARISRENTSSRRYSASYIRSFRDDNVKSNFAISSTASSPGYAIREEIDPSTYSFTNALKALQAKTVYSWEYSSPDGLALNSKWSEAERYICNPLSGEVPIECLSAKALNGRSFRQSSSRINITMSAPLIYPAHSRQFHTKPPKHTLEEDQVKTTIQERKIGYSMTRDVGTQSTLTEISLDSPSSVPTPSIGEGSIKRCETESENSLISSDKETLKEEKDTKETRDEEDTKRNEEKEEEEKKKLDKHKKIMWKCNQIDGAGVGADASGRCLSWRSFWMKKKPRQGEIIRKPRMTIIKNIFVCHLSGC